MKIQIPIEVDIEFVVDQCAKAVENLSVPSFPDWRAAEIWRAVKINESFATVSRFLRNKTVVIEFDISDSSCRVLLPEEFVK